MKAHTLCCIYIHVVSECIGCGCVNAIYLYYMSTCTVYTNCLQFCLRIGVLLRSGAYETMSGDNFPTFILDGTHSLAISRLYLIYWAYQRHALKQTPSPTHTYVHVKFEFVTTKKKNGSDFINAQQFHKDAEDDLVTYCHIVSFRCVHWQVAIRNSVWQHKLLINRRKGT